CNEGPRSSAHHRKLRYWNGAARSRVRGTYLCLGASVLPTAFPAAHDRLKHSPWRNFVNALAPRLAYSAIVTVAGSRRFDDLTAAVKLKFVSIKNIVQQHQRCACANRQMHSHSDGSDNALTSLDYRIKPFQRLNARGQTIRL